jgi:SAM-dependent methyltransferase
MTASHDAYFEYLQGRSRLGALYRRHVLYPRLARRLRGRTLDIGCGIGDMLAFRRGTVGVDINPRTVRYCRSRGLDARVMDPDRLPFDGGMFDTVLLDNVIEHIAHPQPLLAEIRRVLVPRGHVLIGVPGRKGWDSDADHKVRYDEAALQSLLSDAGYVLVESFHAPLVRSDWLSRHVRQYCIYMRFAVRDVAATALPGGRR